MLEPVFFPWTSVFSAISQQTVQLPQDWYLLSNIPLIMFLLFSVFARKRQGNGLDIYDLERQEKVISV